ncbi:MAG: DNA polymerase III subunit delta', partial [Gammaproteobacteria bacterium]
MTATLRESLLPWQADTWRMLQDARRQGRLPHGLLLHGPAGTGKDSFARLLCQSLLCHEPDEAGLPCGRCRGCTLFMAGNHPDLRQLSPLPDKKQIGIDQVREIGDFLSLKSQYGHAQCVHITPAERLNENAANSLLKTLEEPSGDAFLILVTQRPAALPATIRSRCQKLLFPIPDREPALRWLSERLAPGGEADTLLELAAGAPLAALALADGVAAGRRADMLSDLEQLLAGQGDAVTIAAKWLKLDAKESLYWVYGWTVDMVRLRLGGDAPILGNPDLQQRLAALAC